MSLQLYMMLNSLILLNIGLEFTFRFPIIIFKIFFISYIHEYSWDTITPNTHEIFSQLTNKKDEKYLKRESNNLFLL